MTQNPEILPRRIIILGTAHPLRGGLAAYNERLAREYLHQNRNVSLITFSLQYPEVLFPGKSQYTSKPRPEDLSITPLVNSLNPFNWWLVGRKIQRMAPDLLIIKYWIPFMAPALGTIARIARRNGHTRVISILDNIIPHEKRPGDRLLSTYFVRSVDAFLAMSNQVLGDLNQFNQTKPRAFCPHPLYDHYGEIRPKSEACQRLQLDPERKYILFFGFIREYKGLDLLLQAMASDSIRQQDITLIVAGEFYTNPAPYLKLIEDHQLSSQVILKTDYIPDDQVADYFNAADLVVQPYKDATQSGITQIAYHFEKPIVTTNVGGLAEIVLDGRTGFVVNPDPGQIADAICRFFSVNAEEFIRNIREEKQKYSWGRLVGAMDELYLKIRKHDLSE